MAIHELILGGQKSGKSSRAESLARDWLNASPNHGAKLIATACAHDEQMRLRIARHQADRRMHLPELQTHEESRDLVGAITRREHANTLIVIDCMTLWLTNLLMPMDEGERLCGEEVDQHIANLFAVCSASPSPIVFISNEIGLGLIPMGAQVRDFMDRLGLLNQGLAGICQQATLMVAGIPVKLK